MAVVIVVMAAVMAVVASVAENSWIIYICISTEELLPGNSWKISTY